MLHDMQVIDNGKKGQSDPNSVCCRNCKQFMRKQEERKFDPFWGHAADTLSNIGRKIYMLNTVIYANKLSKYLGLERMAHKNLCWFVQKFLTNKVCHLISKNMHYLSSNNAQRTIMVVSDLNKQRNWRKTPNLANQ